MADLLAPPALRGEIAAARQTAVALGIAVGAPLVGSLLRAMGRGQPSCAAAAAALTLILYSLLPESMEPDSGAAIITTAHRH